MRLPVSSVLPISSQASAPLPPGRHICRAPHAESGKVVLLDTQLPVRQAFHALHDQGVTSAPLWDSTTHSMAGMISASGERLDGRHDMSGCHNLGYASRVMHSLAAQALRDG